MSDDAQEHPFSDPSHTRAAALLRACTGVPSDERDALLRGYAGRFASVEIYLAGVLRDMLDEALAGLVEGGPIVAEAVRRGCLLVVDDVELGGVHVFERLPPGSAP